MSKWCSIDPSRKRSRDPDQSYPADELGSFLADPVSVDALAEGLTLFTR